MRVENSNLIEQVRASREKFFWGIEPVSLHWQVLGSFDHRRLGLAIIKHVLEREGWRVKNYYENKNNPLSDFSDFALDTPGTAVGISTITCTAPRAYELAHQIKQKYAHVPIILGGFHPTACPDEALDHADIIVRGEGEETIRELLCSSKPLHEIPGISYWLNGAKKHNPSRAFLKKLSYPSFLLDPGVCQIDLTPILFGRGCPYRCTFCSVTQVMGSEMRCRPADEVVNELKELIKMGIKRVFFIDDNFFGNLDAALELLRLMRKEEVSLPIVIQMRADLRIANNPEILQLMKDVGIFLLVVGLEFVEEAALEEVHKGLKLSQVKEFAAVMRKQRFTIYAMFIFGGVKDTTDTPRKIIAFMRQYLPYELLQIMLLVPLPGTKLADETKERIIDCNWTNYDANRVVWKHPHMEPAQQYKSLLSAYKAWHNPLNLGKIFTQKILTRQKEALFVGWHFLNGIFHTMQEWEKIIKDSKLQQNPESSINA